jgi:hypothetical protein
VHSDDEGASEDEDDHHDHQHDHHHDNDDEAKVGVDLGLEPVATFAQRLPNGQIKTFVVVLSLFSVLCLCPVPTQHRNQTASWCPRPAPSASSKAGHFNNSATI